ncbi:NADH dehydrogenase [ubiquinone] 1 beta subcomplex subunit 7, partial [Mucuna pruriens]
MEFEGSSKKMIASQEEMVEARVPLAYRDECAHLLIPLNKCRHAELYLPWKCQDERHSYEKCQYELVMERMIQMQKIRDQHQKANSKQPLVLEPLLGTDVISCFAIVWIKVALECLSKDFFRLFILYFWLFLLSWTHKGVKGDFSGKFTNPVEEIIQFHETNFNDDCCIDKYVSSY